jgi:hypothetical protein
MNSLYARRLWLMFRFDLMNAAILITLLIAGFWAMDFAAFLCRAEGWCS